MLHAITIREDHDRPKFSYFVGCSCFWEGRFVNLTEARAAAKLHAEKRAVGIDKADINDETKESEAATQDAGQEKPVGKKGKWKKW
jgi:hypothetical protein